MTVYAVQKHQRFNFQTQQFEDKFNFKAAEEYGEVKFLLSPTASPFNLKSILPELKHHLRDLTEEDYLLLVGNPILIGLTTLIAGMYCKNLNFLQWSGKDQKYIKVTTNRKGD